MKMWANGVLSLTFSVINIIIIVCGLSSDGNLSSVYCLSPNIQLEPRTTDSD